MTYVWYPAIAPDKPTDEQSKLSKYGWFQATHDSKAAPYPLSIASGGFRVAATGFSTLTLPLASQGFVVAGINHPNDPDPVSLVDRPLDILFVLDQLTERNKVDFNGFIDTDRVGVMGHSYGAYTTLAVTGARIDPASASQWGVQPIGPGTDADPHNIWLDWNWDAVASYRARLSPVKSDELWTPITDKRILAAVMLSPCEIAMFGEHGLAAATVPVLIIEGTGDPVCPYKDDTLYVFAHLGSTEINLLSVVNADHFSYMDNKHLPAITQFDTAFFGYYLRGQKDYAQYLTAKYVDSIEAELKFGLVWGPYTGK